MSFSGSINETASAWVNNDEEFKVFKEWTDAREYFVRDRKRFNEIWNDERKNVKVYNLPSAIKSNIIHYSSDFDKESISLKKYSTKERKQSPQKTYTAVLLFNISYIKCPIIQFSLKSNKSSIVTSKTFAMLYAKSIEGL